MKKYEAAIHAWNQAQKYGMNRASAMTRIGDCYLSMNDLENAQISYQITLAAGYDKYACLGMLRIYLKKNKIDKAFETLELLKRNEPQDPRIASEYKSFIEKYPHVTRNEK